MVRKASEADDARGGGSTDLGMLHAPPEGDRVPEVGPAGQQLHPDNVSNDFVAAVAALKEPVPEISIHGLRHTHATHLLASGANPKVVSERLGHHSVAFTLDTYAHVMPGQQADAAAAVAKLLNQQR